MLAELCAQLNRVLVVTVFAQNTCRRSSALTSGSVHYYLLQMVTCLQLASEQLARRGHYDFGMRAAVAVLNTAKHIFLQQLNPLAEPVPSPSKSDSFKCEEEATRLEAMTVCKALRLTNIPKLHPTDKLIFEEILKDVFDESDLAAADSEQSLRPFLKEAAEKLLLEPSEELLTTSLQVRWAAKKCLERQLLTLAV